MKKYPAMALVAAASFAAAMVAVNYNHVPPDLYQAKSLVTGQRDETRIPGFERALVDVLKKVSGDAGISAGEVLAAIDGPIHDQVQSYSERDRMAGIPIHDEQGTRDRPFELTVTFHRDKIEGLLKKLGRAAWTGRRPQTLVILTVKTDSGTYVLTSDEDRGIDQRDSLLSAAWQAGIPVTLPTRASLADNSSMPAALVKANGADIAMIGSLAWNSGMKGWQADWQIEDAAVKHTWGIRDVNFDDAFRNAMRGEAQILSGHGNLRDGLK